MNMNSGRAFSSHGTSTHPLVRVDPSAGQASRLPGERASAKGMTGLPSASTPVAGRTPSPRRARSGSWARCAIDWPWKHSLIGAAAGVALIFPVLRSAETESEAAWRPLPLIRDGKVDAAWVHVGWGGFAVDDGVLRTECDPKGLGLLVYKKERFGNCQIRVVFKSKEARSNSGVYVRIADGILEQAGRPNAAFDRDAAGTPSKESMEKVKASAEREEGPWFAVHRGYEVQIADSSDPFHRTGAIYSLAPSSALSKTPPGEWRTLIVTLAGNRVFVDLDGQRITSFDPRSPDLPARKQWYEPKREPTRPEAGYIGLQNHDPGDVVWFKEISVRPLPSAGAN
jgi:Domain of Unknown Function (DUF1080)